MKCFRRIGVPALLCLMCLVFMGQDGDHQPPTGVGGPRLTSGVGTGGIVGIGGQAVIDTFVAFFTTDSTGVVDHQLQEYDDEIAGSDGFPVKKFLLGTQATVLDTFEANVPEFAYGMVK